MENSNCSSYPLSSATRQKACFVVGLIGLLVVSRASHAYTPESPRVKQMIERGVAFLDSSEPDERLGGQCLVAMVMVKQGRKNHTLVKTAVEFCIETCKLEPQDFHDNIYSLGIAIIFLSELDASQYRSEIDKFIHALRLRQKEGGGWGYEPGTRSGNTGDTSMTQYAVLALWTARQNGIRVPDTMLVRVCNWLLRTQDPSGGWGYQGDDPGIGNTQRVRQTQIRHSLCAAAAGSLYVCASALGLGITGVPSQFEHQQLDLPPALKPVGPLEFRGKPSPDARRIDMARWRRAINDGRLWFEKNSFEPSRAWPNYYLYALERYQSFRELSERRSQPEPQWYNIGVDYLARAQRKDGSWIGQGGIEVSTAFAVLFLTRSTQRSIQRAGYGDGRLTGGRGLPKNVSSVRVRQGKIVSAPLGVEVDDVIAVLEDPNNAAYDYVTESDEDIRLSDDPVQRTGQVGRLRRLLQSGSYKARAAAAEALSQRRDLDDVPYLLRALTDPDTKVRATADQGLRYISRRLNGVGDGPGDSNPVSAAARVEGWTRWYRSIRPDAQPVK